VTAVEGERPAGVFGVDIAAHHNRDPGQQSRLERILEALIGAINPEQTLIASTGIEVVEMLLSKNLKYGSSATDPIRVFSKLPPEEGILIRCDDKLSRIRAGAADEDEDPIFDLAGYLILLMVARRQRVHPSDGQEAAG
jgi:hypothetical protein